MKNKPFTKDRRRQPRFKVRGTVIALARSPASQRGTVTEISRTSLTFQYRENGHCRITAQEIDIIWADFVAAHHLKKLPIQTLSDIVLNPNEKKDDSAIRRKIVKFTNLSSEQNIRLAQLIRECGVGAH